MRERLRRPTRDFRTGFEQSGARARGIGQPQAGKHNPAQASLVLLSIKHRFGDVQVKRRLPRRRMVAD